MAAMSRLLPMMAFSTFAIFLLALLATPTNALSNTEPHVHARGHDSIAKRKRNALKRAKRCRPKSTSLPIASSTSAAASNTPAPTTTSKASTHPVTTKPATSTATTSKAVATTSVNTSSGGGGTKKLILAWPNGTGDIGKWRGKNLKGIYTWSPYDANAASIGAAFYPMVWGAKQKTTFQDKATGDYDMCLGMNEPNQSGQSDMSVADAVSLWWATMEPAGKRGSKLVSPATTSAPSGKQWMKDFFAQCNGCTIDFVAIHWYDVSADAFIAYVTDFFNTFGKPIIISEFACQNFNNGPQCSKDQTWGLHQRMAKFAKDTPWIVGIAPFGAMREMQGVNPDNQMMDPSTGSPNDLGQFWLNGNW